MNLTEFERVAQRLRPRILARAESIVGDSETAADIAQETLLRLWQMRGRLDEIGNLDGLVTVMTRNLALDVLRSRARNGGAPVSLDALYTAADSTPDPQSTLENAEAVEKVEAIMQQLAPGQQVVMKMRHVDGLEIEEIARVLGSTENNVRVLLCRARAKVKQIFTELNQ